MSGVIVSGQKSQKQNVDRFGYFSNYLKKSTHWRIKLKSTNLLKFQINLTNSMENFTTEVNQTIVRNSPAIMTTVLVMVCDCFNIGLTSYCIRQMYLGIEIGHPVYATLFCNLISVLAICIVEILVLPFLKNIRAETIVKSGAALYAMFQGTCWLVISILRYLYIVHNNWLHKKFQGTRTLTLLSIGLVYFVYSFCLGTLIPVLVHHGWPFIGMTEMDPTPRLICIGTLVANEGGILIVSSIFYFMILHHRGGIGKSSVDVLTAASNREEQKSVSNKKVYLPKPTKTLQLLFGLNPLCLSKKVKVVSEKSSRCVSIFSYYIFI